MTSSLARLSKDSALLRRRLQRRNKRALVCEALEARRLLVGDVTIAFSGVDLKVTGSNDANEIAITAFDGEIVAEGFNGTTINGGGSGPVVIVPGTTTIAGKMKVDLRDGDDILVLGNFNVAKDVDLKANDGANRFGLFGIIVGEDLKIHSKDGNTTVVVHDTSVGGEAEIDTADGHDFVGLCNVQITNGLRVETKKGNDTFAALMVTTGEKSNIDLHNGQDATIVQDSQFGDKFDFQTGNDNDFFYVATSTFDELRAHLQKGDDQAVFKSNTFNDDFDVDGGHEVTADRIEENGNTFNGSQDIDDFEAFTISQVNIDANVNPILADLNAAKVFLASFLNRPPRAEDDSYETAGHTLLDVGGANGDSVAQVDVAGSVLDNDVDENEPALFIAAVEGVALNVGVEFSLGGGQGDVLMNSDGTFTFSPAIGFSGVASFEYTVEDDGGRTDVGTVAVTVAAPTVWYVGNNCTITCDGRSDKPFATLASAEAASGSSETIFVYAGDTTDNGQDAGIVLKSSQALLGQGVDLVLPTFGTVFTGTPLLKPLISNLNGAPSEPGGVWSL